jgi:hypothetical protein
VENLEWRTERVCVTWSIFKLKNTSGVNYIFILGTGSVVEATATIHGYGSNNKKL